MFDDKKYPTACGSISGGTIDIPKVEETLNLKKQDLEKRLKDVNSSIEALRKQPELLEVLNLLRRVGI